MNGQREDGQNTRIEFKSRLSSVDSFAQSEREARAGRGLAEQGPEEAQPQRRTSKKSGRERQRSSATIFRAHPGDLVVI